MQLIPFNQKFDHHSRGVCAAIGVFDAVHRGHQSVIGRILEDARAMEATPIVITFDKHPAAVLSPEHTPRMIYPLEERLRLFEQYGIDTALVIPFDAEIASLSAEDFFRCISSNLCPLMSVSVGVGFLFARNRTGNVESLRRMSEETHTIIHEVSAVCSEGIRISSTRIRSEIAAGHLARVNEMLGRPFSLISNVVHGDAIGRTIGFPTANLEMHGRAIPPVGVYAVKVIIEGKERSGCMSIGVRPTLKDKAHDTRVEVYILDFNEDIYGQRIEVIPLKFLRTESKFTSLDALKRQIAIDVEQSRHVVSL